MANALTLQNLGKSWISANRKKVVFALTAVTAEKSSVSAFHGFDTNALTALALRAGANKRKVSFSPECAYSAGLEKSYK